MKVPGHKVQELADRFKLDPVFQEIYTILQENDWTNLHQAVAIYLYLDNSICWDTKCLNCARLLDQLYLQDCELDRIKNGREDSDEGQEAQPL